MEPGAGVERETRVNVALDHDHSVSLGHFRLYLSPCLNGPSLPPRAEDGGGRVLIGAGEMRWVMLWQAMANDIALFKESCFIHSSNKQRSDTCLELSDRST